MRLHQPEAGRTQAPCRGIGRALGIWRRPAHCLVAATCCLSLAAGCGSGASDSAGSRAASQTTSTMVSTTADLATSSTSPSTPATTTTASASTDPALPPFPAEFQDLVHGGDVWAVVLAASGAPDDSVLNQAVAHASNAGYATGPTSCDRGAGEALGRPGAGTYTVSVYLASEPAARAAVNAFEARGVSAVAAKVQTFCLD